MGKPTADELWNTEFFQKHAQAALKRALAEYEEELVVGFQSAIKECESPLEAAFAAWWSALGHAWRWRDLKLVHQHPLMAAGASYRIDLVIAPFTGGEFQKLIGHPLMPKIAIELDGHDFHERTKDQVALRNRRDRELMADRWIVWHISGSEFHGDPFGSVSNAEGEATRLFSDAMRSAGFWRFQPKG